MAAARIKIYKKNMIVTNGRQQEKEPELFYETWCEIGSLYGRELYEALDKRLENTIIFEVRYCQRIKEMQRSLKLFFVEYEGEKYDIYAADYRRNEKQYIQLKANKCD